MKMFLCLALFNMSIRVIPYLYPPPNDFSFLVNVFMFIVYVPKPGADPEIEEGGAYV